MRSDEAHRRARRRGASALSAPACCPGDVGVGVIVDIEIVTLTRLTALGRLTGLEIFQTASTAFDRRSLAYYLDYTEYVLLDSVTIR